MSKFNSKIDNSIITHEGGKAYKRNSLEAFMNFLFSSYLENRFYEDADSQIGRFQKLTQEVIDEYGAAFAAKAAVFARKVLGMRSSSQFVAAMLNSEQFENKRHFFASIPNRPDDVAEIFAAIDMLGDKRSHATIRGFSDYLSTLGEYQIGKYKMAGKQYNMFDLINLTHAHSAAIDAYKNGTLAAPDTWEVNISDATKDEGERNQEWRRMVEEEKLGYMALIRNLNNILTSGVTEDWIVKYLIPQLENKDKIKGSKCFPYRIFTAYKNLHVFNTNVIQALEHAFRAAVDNTPVFEGSTCIMLDVSGSMDDLISAKSNISIKEVGACYAASILLKNPQVSLVKFGIEARIYNFNPLDNIFKSIERMQDDDYLGYGTYIDSAFEQIKDISFDRIFLISDMQIMDADSNPWRYSDRGIRNYNQYCAAHGRTKMYSFDLSNYTGQIASPNNPDVYLLTSLNDTIISMVPFLENGAELFNIINNIEY